MHWKCRKSQPMCALHGRRMVLSPSQTPSSVTVKLIMVHSAWRQEIGWGGANRWGPHSRLMVYWRLTSIKEVHENPQYLVHQKLSIDILGLTIKQNSLASTKFQSEESSRRPIHCKQCDLIELGYFTNEKFQRHLF